MPDLVRTYQRLITFVHGVRDLSLSCLKLRINDAHAVSAPLKVELSVSARPSTAKKDECREGVRADGLDGG